MTDHTIDPATFANDIPYSLASAAHTGTSFTPERRAEQERESYANGLASDYALFHSHAVKGGTLAALDVEFAQYRARLRRLTAAYLQSKSRCLSTMIAGSSNFPARRMQKRSDVADKRCAQLCDFQERGRAAVIRNLRPDLQPIRTEDDNAIERLKKEIEQKENLQAAMKAANLAIRKNAKAGPEAQIAALVSLDLFGAARAADLLKPDFCGRVGFADYELTNNGANIRRLKARLETVTRAKAAPVVEVANSTTGITLEDDPPGNRVRLIFPGKPSEEIRARLKSNGFRWAPTSGAWQAYRNNTSMAFATAFAAKGA